jgi:hypothetical protein
MSKRFPSVDIREVDLDDGAFHIRDGVSKRITVMGVRARIKEYPGASL